METYERIHCLGRGGCGSVYLVRHKETRKLFALKKIELDDRKKTRTREMVEKEAKILSQLKHPHIVLFHESFVDENIEHLSIIQDYCDGGNMDDKIKDAARKSNYFEESQIMSWFTQIIMAVQYIHSKRVLHRDLKSENVFLTKKNVVKIGDFGISKVLENTIDVAKTIVGTPSYLSPELCQDIPYSSKSDIWAVGCLLYELCALKPPFDAQNLISLFFKIIKGEYQQAPDRYSAELHDLLSSMLVTTPDDRPSASAILNTAIVKTHLARFIAEKSTLLQQKTTSSKDDSPSHQVSTPKHKHTPNSERHSTTSSPQSTPVLQRNNVKISSSMIHRSPRRESPVTSPGTALEPGQKDSGLDVTSELDVCARLEERLQVPRPNADASSDYSDDFDESEPESENDEIVEEITADSAEESDIEDESVDPDTDPAEGTEYADDFEEYDSSEDLDALVSQAKEAQDIEAVDDWFSDSLSAMCLPQTIILQQHCEYAMDGRGLKEVGKLVSDGTLTEDDLRSPVELRRSIGEDDVEICHLNIGDLDPD